MTGVKKKSATTQKSRKKADSDIIEQKTNEELLKRTNRTLNALRHSSEALIKAESEKEFLDEVCKIIIEDCGHAMVWIGYKENDKNKSVTPAAYSGFEEGYLETLKITWADTPRGRGPTGKAVRTGKPSFCRNMLTDPEFKPWRKEALKRGYASSLVLPLLDGENVLGALSIYFREPDPFLKDEVQLLSELANNLAYGIKSIRLQKIHLEAQEKIERAAKLWQITFDSIPDMVSIQDKDFRLVNVNKAYERTFNFPPDYLIGKKCYEIVHKSDCPVENCPLQKTLETKQITAEEIFEPRLGIYFEVITSPLFDENGELFGSFHVAKDITERKNFQEALRKSENRYHGLVETAPDPLIVDRNNKIIYLNPSAREFLGISLDEEITGKLTSEVVGSEYYSLINDWINIVLNGDGFQAKETKIVRPDGSIRHCEISASRFEDAEGAAVQVILHDITNRKLAEQKLQESEAQFRILTEAMPQIVWSADKSGKADFYNRQIYDFSGIDKDKADKIDWALTIHPGDISEFRTKWSEAVESGKIFSMEQRLRRADGQYRWHLTRGVPVLNSSGDIIRWIGTATDIHEQKTIEETLKKRVNQQTEELRKTNAYNRNLLEVSPDALFTFGPDGKFTDVNKAAEAITGLERDKLIGTDFSSYFTEPNKALECYHKVFSQGTIRDFPLTIKHVSGKTYDVLYNASVYRNEEGRVQGVFADARDISEIKKAEADINLHAERYKAILSATPDGFWIVDKSGGFLDVNDVYLKMSGYSYEEFMSLSLSDIEALETAEETTQHINKFLEVDFDRFETKHKRKDGSIFEVELSASYWKIKDQSLCFVRDITKRKKTEAIIAAERKRFNDVLEMLPAYVVLLTPDHRVRHSNRFFNERFGEDRGRCCFEFLFDLDKPCEGCKTFEVFKEKKAIEWEWTGPDGSNYYIYDFPFSDVDGTDLVMEMCSDISELKRAEQRIRQLNEELEKRVQLRTAELQFANQELESFSYSVSHDLRTPLSVIDGFSKILYKDLFDKLDDEYKNYLNRIISASGKMSALITGLLNLSRISRAKLQLKDVRLDLIATDIITWLFKSEPYRKISINIKPGITAYADPEFINIVLENLINNAWKFTRFTQSAEIQIGSKKQNGEVIFFVRDNGAGFNMKDSDKLFNPFQRLHDRKLYEGTGIGLATVKRIISKHGGKIWVESEPGSGTTFYFQIPR